MSKEKNNVYFSEKGKDGIFENQQDKGKNSGNHHAYTNNQIRPFSSKLKGSIFHQQEWLMLFFSFSNHIFA